MDFSEYCDQPQDMDGITVSENEEVDSDDEQILGVNDKVFQGSLHIILDSLSNDNPLLVSEVKTVVKELRRITLLWDELWIGSLVQLNHEAQRYAFEHYVGMSFCFHLCDLLKTPEVFSSNRK